MANRYVDRKIYKLDWENLANFGKYSKAGVPIYDPCVYLMCNMTINEGMLRRSIQHRIGKATNMLYRLQSYKRPKGSNGYRTHYDKIQSETTHVIVLKMPDMPHTTEEQRRRKNIAMEELEDTLIKLNNPKYNIRQKTRWEIIANA